MMNQISIPTNKKITNLIAKVENILKNIAETGSNGKNTIEFQNTILTAIGIEYLKLKNTEMIFKHRATITIKNIIIKVTVSKNIKGSQDE